MGFITVSGENQLAAKSVSNDLNVVSFVLANINGLGAEPVDRIESMPAGGDIVATLPVTKSGYVNTNQVVYSLVMDSSLGDYDFNWVGLVDDEGVLIAVTYTPLIEKRKTAGAVPGNNLTRNFLVARSGIQATTAIAVPAETWQIDFNARLHGIDERERLSNFDLYGHDSFINDGWKVVRQGATTTYDLSVGLGYVGGIRSDNAALQQVTANPLDSVWMDVSLQGDISDVSAVISFVVDAAIQNDYTDGLGFVHYLTKIADIAADGSVTDLRNKKYNGVGKTTIRFDESTPEDNELERDGTILIRADFSYLWEWVQEKATVITEAAWQARKLDTGTVGVFSDGDGSTTFRLPDNRGDFIRFWDHGAGNDPDAALRSGGDTNASNQNGEIEAHSHAQRGTTDTTPQALHSSISNATNSTTEITNTSTENTGGNETRSRNVTVMACIQFKPDN